MKDVFIVSAVRTPTGKFLGALKGFKATELGAMVVGDAVSRAGLKLDRPEHVDEVIMGNVVSAGLGQNPARQAALGAGLPPEVAALTINKVCGSGLKAVMLARQAIIAGDAEVVVAGGMESMSNAPYLVRRMREGLRLGHGELVDAVVHDGLWDIFNDFHMGITGEKVAEKYDVTREAMDGYAAESHRRAAAATEAGKFRDEILPVEIPQRKGDPIVLDRDEPIRADTSADALSKLKPVFKKDGTVTAGNAPGMNDGAAALVVASAKAVEEHGLKPLARIVAQAISGLEPEWVMMTPVPAVRKLLEKTGWTNDDVDLIELNEAFAVQACAVTQELSLDPEKTNVNGGAVALGHPIGASGARVLTTLLYALKDRDGRRGIATLCLGGGNGVALAVELVS
ncbi:MAG: acetyl-CoA C-acetyltransferase [Acidobacteriota bacterium]|nr:MAG: acetyl-CoA C-acetyltransferase [Acidobacteriota bacterium]